MKTLSGMMRTSAGTVLVLLVGACGGGSSGPDAAFRAERPGDRSDIAGVAGANGNIAVFGGDHGPVVNQMPRAEYLGDTWVLEPALGWFLANSVENPSARGRYAVTYDSDNDAMLLFGGRFRPDGDMGAYTLYNDLWSFSFASNEWSLVHDGAGTAPSGRYFSNLAYNAQNQTVYMFGGGVNTSGLNLTPNMEVWAYSGGSWSQVTTSGTAPSTRMFTGYTYDPSRNRMIVHAGQIGDFFASGFRELFALDMNTNTWSVLHDGGGTEGVDVPLARFSSMLFYDTARDRYVMAGGHQDFLLGNDVWAFDPNNDTWSLLFEGDVLTGGPLGCDGNPQEIPDTYVTQILTAPQPRNGGVLAGVGDQAYWFGGESDCNKHLDDTWVFDLTTNTWRELISARTGESCAREGNACTCLCL